MNYTKGEWKIRVHGLTNVIEVATPEKVRAKVYTVAEGIYKKENAHLIAAAPELYEALKEVINQLYTAGSVSLGDLEIAEKALAKAEGK
jgi:hypothetical protein